MSKRRKVFVVLWMPYEEWTVFGVFRSEEAAEDEINWIIAANHPRYGRSDFQISDWKVFG